eukprot:TRINITY_DN7347_c0_g1_i2.p1 TRINITY_DN7347_c0_g1~~TRINITY_DN7347_c0_g1_i2.p1  ORF type:complete len:343 (+),score=69.55 TRINITY_DN7347_c0_g1_i2:199-1227(+)
MRSLRSIWLSKFWHQGFHKYKAPMFPYEWVLIGSKNYLHRDHCLESFQLGKNVFCEKPLAITFDQCHEIRNVHRESGKLFATGFVLRHAAFYQKIRQLVQDGQVGRLVSIEANELLKPYHGGYIMRNWRRFRSQSGPHILEKCCHDIDLLNWIVGSLPSKVASFGGLNSFIPENKPASERIRDEYAAWDFAYEDVDPFESEKDIEDNQVAILQYGNGVRVSFHTNSNSALSQRKMTICGVLGTIEANLITGEINLYRVGRSSESIGVGAQGMHGGADPKIAADLASSIELGVLPASSGEEGFTSAIVCLAIDEARIKSCVVDMEPIWHQFNIQIPKTSQTCP